MLSLSAVSEVTTMSSLSVERVPIMMASRICEHVSSGMTKPFIYFNCWQISPNVVIEAFLIATSSWEELLARSITILSHYPLGIYMAAIWAITLAALLIKFLSTRVLRQHPFIFSFA